MFRLGGSSNKIIAVVGIFFTPRIKLLSSFGLRTHIDPLISRKDAKGQRRKGFLGPGILFVIERRILSSIFLHSKN